MRAIVPRLAPRRHLDDLTVAEEEQRIRPQPQDLAGRVGALAVADREAQWPWRPSRRRSRCRAPGGCRSGCGASQPAAASAVAENAICCPSGDQAAVRTRRTGRAGPNDDAWLEAATSARRTTAAVSGGTEHAPWVRRAAHGARTRRCAGERLRSRSHEEHGIRDRRQGGRARLGSRRSSAGPSGGPAALVLEGETGRREDRASGRPGLGLHEQTRLSGAGRRDRRRPRARSASAGLVDLLDGCLAEVAASFRHRDGAARDRVASRGGERKIPSITARWPWGFSTSFVLPAGALLRSRSTMSSGSTRPRRARSLRAATAAASPVRVLLARRLVAGAEPSVPGAGAGADVSSG